MRKVEAITKKVAQEQYMGNGHALDKKTQTRATLSHTHTHTHTRTRTHAHIHTPITLSDCQSTTLLY